MKTPAKATRLSPVRTRSSTKKLKPKRCGICCNEILVPGCFCDNNNNNKHTHDNAAVDIDRSPLPPVQTVVAKLTPVKMVSFDIVSPVQATLSPPKVLEDVFDDAVLVPDLVSLTTTTTPPKSNTSEAELILDASTDPLSLQGTGNHNDGVYELRQKHMGVLKKLEAVEAEKLVLCQTVASLQQQLHQQQQQESDDNLPVLVDTFGYFMATRPTW